MKDIVRRASECTGVDLYKLLFYATDEELKSTDLAQIAITTVNIAAAATLAEHGVGCDGAAGFSVGEYAALYVAGVVGLEDVYALVKARGDAMAQASLKLHSSDGAPGMAAVIGLSYETVKEVSSQRLHDVYVANYNSPTQIVIGSTAEGLKEAEKVLKDSGARRVIPLKVSGPFHTPLIREARECFQKFIADYNFADPKIPVYSNVTGARIQSGSEAKELCIRQITSTVRWVDDERAMLADGFERIVETGPGAVLTGLWKAVGDGVPCFPAGTYEQIQNLARG